MRKDDYRKILSEKFRAANQLETNHLTEEDEEYLLILAEARANHARIKADRQAARKRLAARAAAVLIIAALVSSSYLLGMKSDSKASADPDDEVKVVQQGDNIIIGPGVSEGDENVGVVTKTYTKLSRLPIEMRHRVESIENQNLMFTKAKMVIGKSIETQIYYFEDKNHSEIIIIFEKIIDLHMNIDVARSYDSIMDYNDVKIYCKEYNESALYYFDYSDSKVIVTISKLSKIKIEDIIDASLFRMD